MMVCVVVELRVKLSVSVEVSSSVSSSVALIVRLPGSVRVPVALTSLDSEGLTVIVWLSEFDLVTQAVGEIVRVSVDVSVIDPRWRRRRSDRLSVEVTESNVYVGSSDCVVVILPVRHAVNVSVPDMVSGRVFWLRVVVSEYVDVPDRDLRSESVN